MTIGERFRLIIPLVILSLIGIACGLKLDGDDGFFVSLGTGIAGIVITIVYVDIIIEKHEKRKWKAVSELLKKEIYITSNVLVSSLRTAFGIDPYAFLGTSTMNKMIEMNERDIAIEVLKAYKTLISRSVYEHIAEMDEKSYDLLLINLGNVYNACINFQSMYNSIASPNQIECIMTVTSETYSIIQQFKLFPEFYTMPNEEIISELGEEKAEVKFHSQKKIGETINQLIDILYKEVVAVGDVK